MHHNVDLREIRVTSDVEVTCECVCECICVCVCVCGCVEIPYSVTSVQTKSCRKYSPLITGIEPEPRSRATQAEYGNGAKLHTCTVLVPGSRLAEVVSMRAEVPTSLLALRLCLPPPPLGLPLPLLVPAGVGWREEE